MTVTELAASCGFTIAAQADPDRPVDGCYCGDLLSWVMGRAQADCAWITIMSNVNVVAVGSLADVACVILSEGVTADEKLLETARVKGVNILYSEKPTYETATAVYRATGAA